MSFTDSRAPLFALVILAGACAPKSSADATVEPDGSAVASANSATTDSHDGVAGTTDSRPLSRSGVRIHKDIIDACKIEGASTYFDFDSEQLDDQGHAVLANVATCVKDGALSGRDLIVVGYTDPRGTDAYNKELGTSRAASVAKCLHDNGVPPTKVELESRGEEQASTDPNDWPSDRRVELELAAADTTAR